MSYLQKKILGKGAGLPPLPQDPSSSSVKRTLINKRDYSAKPWSDYFEEKQQIRVGNNLFQFYQSGTPGSVLVVFLHGGGFSGLSWALLSKTLTSRINCRCIALDLRGHGETETEDEYELSAETLSSDVCDVIEKLEIDSPIVLVGHSMGGAIAVHTAKMNRLHRLAGLIVIDVVEGTALESLHGMRHVLQSRPRSFETIEKANEWCVRTGYIRNLESARVSMIGQLKRQDSSEAASSANQIVTSIIDEESIVEEEGSRSKDQPIPTPSSRYVWRIDLSRTEPYWEGWFKGMSAIFLSVPVPKVLLLAGVDRLDKELNIGQMQGKFQLQVMSKSGHAVHEDIPDKVADVIANFLLRHKLSELKT